MNGHNSTHPFAVSISTIWYAYMIHPMPHTGRHTDLDLALQTHEAGGGCALDEHCSGAGKEVVVCSVLYI